MINCIAIDDEPIALDVIKDLCSNVPFINLSHTFNRVSLAQKHLNKFPVDLIFLDIEMPDKNGFEFLKTINQNVMVIFTTAYSKYAVEGFNVNAIDYLLKPIDLNRFIIACTKANDFLEYSNSSTSRLQNSLYVRSEYALIKILHSEIRYLETLDDYIKIHTTDRKTILTLMSMKKILEKLPENEFIRVHRSFTVSLSKISSIRNNTILLGDANIPIGTNYKKEVQDIYSSRK
ncbi:MAG: response regulator transcription factor [Methylotenera sp.]|nr:response regulator transcription factor [Flavobacterium sp.]